MLIDLYVITIISIFLSGRDYEVRGRVKNSIARPSILRLADVSDSFPQLIIMQIVLIQKR